MTISVITPTFGRPEMLPNLYHAFASQDFAQRELLIYDDSATPAPLMAALGPICRRARGDV